MRILLALLLFSVAFLLWYFFYLPWLRRRRGRDRMFEEQEAAPHTPPLEEEPAGLRRYLFLAGFRTPAAPAVFVLSTGLAFFLGGAAVWLIYTFDVFRPAYRLVDALPGGFWDVLIPLIYLAPPVLWIAVTCLPWLIVRGARRRRVTQVEQDLPITLELLATLAEAGLAFDAALERILSSQSPDRPLAQELRTFQLELLAGRPRIQSLRRLSRRLDITAFTTFISALIQAEQIGAGIAQVLRVQVEEFRSRRRERALRLAMTLPVKLIFPLIVCFLPGLFVALLGPAFYQIVEFLDNFTRQRGLL